jgi:hypothetical protein
LKIVVLVQAHYQFSDKKKEKNGRSHTIQLISTRRIQEAQISTTMEHFFSGFFFLSVEKNANALSRWFFLPQSFEHQ